MSRAHTYHAPGTRVVCLTGWVRHESPLSALPVPEKGVVYLVRGCEYIAAMEANGVTLQGITGWFEASGFAPVVPACDRIEEWATAQK